MEKIGILTFHHAYNYGAVLQCFALKTVIKRLGYEVEVINHINPKIKHDYSLKPPTNLLKVANYVLVAFHSFVRFRGFKKFISKYLISKNTQKEEWKGFKAIVWGSDQIWNPDIIGNDKCFWGDVDCGNAIKISYAASAGGNNRIIEEHINSIRKFKSLGVRETQLQVKLNNYNIESAINSDPTLLLQAEDWEKLLPIENNSHGEYLLYYGIRDYSLTRKFASKVAKKYGLKVIGLYSSVQRINITEMSCLASPLEFIRLIKHARFVITDSFHGTVFSLIFHRPFYSIKLQKASDSRAGSLLEKLQLTDRFVIPDHISENDLNENIDYNKVDHLKDKLINDSINYLKNSLKTH